MRSVMVNMHNCNLLTMLQMSLKKDCLPYSVYSLTKSVGQLNISHLKKKSCINVKFAHFYIIIVLTHSVLAHLGHNSSHLIILLGFPCFLQK